jgi:hypothetical protein
VRAAAQFRLLPMSSTRTSSPYFSPNSIIAPVFCASSSAITRAWVAALARISALTSASTGGSPRRVIGALWAKSKRVLSASTSEPFCCTWAPSTSRRALCIRWVAEWLRTVLARAATSTGRDVSPTASLPVRTTPWWPNTRPGSSACPRREDARAAQLAAVADLAAGLGVERRVVEHDHAVVAPSAVH